MEEGTKVTFIQTLILGIVVLPLIGAVVFLVNESTRARSLIVSGFGITGFGSWFMFAESGERLQPGLYLLQASAIFVLTLFFGGEVGIDAAGYDAGDNEHDFDIDMG